MHTKNSDGIVESLQARMRSFVLHFAIGAMIGVVFVLGARVALADPLGGHGGAPHPGHRQPRPWQPHDMGRDGHWVPMWPLPGGGGELPWLRNWITHPEEEDAPGGGEPGGAGDIGGPG